MIFAKCSLYWASRKTMKNTFILLALIVVLTGCRKGGTGTGNGTSCWACAIEGEYNGTLVDIDTTICNKTQAGIDEFMAQHNASGQVIACERKSP